MISDVCSFRSLLSVVLGFNRHLNKRYQFSSQNVLFTFLMAKKLCSYLEKISLYANKCLLSATMHRMWQREGTFYLYESDKGIYQYGVRGEERYNHQQSLQLHLGKDILKLKFWH